MKISVHPAIRRLVATLAAVLALYACGARQSVASRSAAAFREAQAKGIPIDKGGHGGHENAPESSDTKGTNLAGSEPGGMTGMNMSGSKSGSMTGMNMSGSKSGSMAGMNMSGSKSGGMAGMDMSGSKSGGMAGMNMSGSKSGGMAGMNMSGSDMSAIVPQPEALQARPGETADTLRADPLDAPASTSLAAAARPAENGEMMMPMGHYVQHDVGGQPSAGDHQTTGEMPGMDMSRKESPKPVHAEAVTYVCASHPEIVRTEPGKCPLDGTPLVRKVKQ